MQPVSILVVDDQPDIRAMVKMVLEKAGYQTCLFENGAQAVAAARELAPDCIVMDVVMPVMDGLEACRQIREFSQVPILLLSARGEEDDLVDGFNAGAYDYMIKPFRPRELVARVQTHLKRSAARPRPTDNLVFDDLVLDPRAQQVRIAGRPIDVTSIGYHLLEYFLRHPGEVISKEQLLRDVWQYTAPVNGGNMVEAAIKRLRKELNDSSREPRYIKTVWGSGYRLG